MNNSGFDLCMSQETIEISENLEKNYFNKFN